MMKSYLITPPSEDVVSLATAKAHLRITKSDTDALLTVMIAGIVETLDPAGQGWLGRALRPQTWEIRGDRFYHYGHRFDHRSSDYCHRHSLHGVPGNAVELPYPPLISIDSIKYDDGNGVEQTLSVGTDYRVFGIGGRGKAFIVPPHNGFWPLSVRCDPESVRVRFTCGYEDDSLPAAIQQAVLLLLSHLWALGERNLFLSSEEVPGVSAFRWAVSETPTAILRTAAETLLAPFRIYD